MKQKIFFEIENFEVLKFTLEDYYKVSDIYTENPHSASVTLQTDTPTAKARWVLMYVHFQMCSKAYKTNDFP